MSRRFPYAVLAAALVVSGGLLATVPHAARMTGAPDRTAGGGSPAEILERYGEPVLAWDALQRAGGPANEVELRLAVRLLTELNQPARADSLLARLILPADPYQAYFIRIQRARLNSDAGRDPVVIELLSGGEAPDAALNAYRGYLLARSQRALGNAAAAAAVLDGLDDGAIPDGLRESLALERIAVLRELGRHKEAARVAAQAARQSTSPALTRELLLLQYESARDAGAPVQSHQAARALFAGHPWSAEAGQVASELAGHDGGRELSSFVLLSCAEVLSQHENVAALRTALRTLDGRGLKGRDAEALRLLWAEYHYETRDYSRAIALARPSYSDTSLRRRSMLVVARSLRRLGKPGEAAAVYEYFVKAYPNDRIAAEALYAAASLYRQDNRDRESVRVLDELRRSYPSTFHGWAAAMRRADDLSRSGRVKEAAAIYEQWLARSRRTDEAALFYLARERERLQRGSGSMILDELRSLNRYSFYVTPDVDETVRGPLQDTSGGLIRSGPGSLMEWLARSESGRTQAYHRVLDAVVNGGAGAASAGDRAIERGLFFLDAGLREWADAELESARRGGPASAERTLKLARVYDEYAMPWRSVRLYERAGSSLPWQERRLFSDDLRVLTHPLPYPAQVLESAARNGIPPHLVYGMIREESRFEADVISHAGAVGLMQLMPQTARRVAAQLDLSREIGDRLDDPAVNVSLGVWYAADLLRDGDGSVAWMLAAYNAGPGAAQRWLDPGVSGSAAIAAVESIDYKETRSYVKRVVESANVYHALYFSGPAPAGLSR